MCQQVDFPISLASEFLIFSLCQSPQPPLSDNYKVIPYSLIFDQLYTVISQCKNPVKEYIHSLTFPDICFLQTSSGSYYGIVDSHLKFQIISPERNLFNHSPGYGSFELLHFIQFGDFYKFRADNDLVCSFCLSKGMEIMNTFGISVMSCAFNTDTVRNFVN